VKQVNVAEAKAHLSELIDAVTLQVARASAGLQTPWVARRELFGDFRLAALPQ